MKRLLVVLLVLYATLVGGAYSFQRKLLYYPPRAPAVKTGEAQRFEDFDIQTKDDLALKGWYIPHTSKKLTILYFHGNADGLESTALLADPFIKAGYGFLIAEYRGYSDEPGQPTEKGLYRDARAYLNGLEQRGIAPQDVVLIGHSLGTGVATEIATEAPVAGLVLLAPFTSMSAMASLKYPYLPTRFLLKDRFDTAEKIKRIHTALFLAQGESDNIVPVDQGRALFRMANEPKQLYLIPDGHHSDLFDYGLSKPLLAWLETRETKDLPTAP